MVKLCDITELHNISMFRTSHMLNSANNKILSTELSPDIIHYFMLSAQNNNWNIPNCQQMPAVIQESAKCSDIHSHITSYSGG